MDTEIYIYTLTLCSRHIYSPLPNPLSHLQRFLTNQLSDTPKMSNTAPAQGQLYIYRQLMRARELTLNETGVQVAPQTIPTVIQQFALQPWNGYNVGYAPGTPIVYCTSATHDPAPVHDQFAHTSAHIYQHFSVVDLPPILFRMEAARDKFVDATGRDIPVPMLHNYTTRQPIVTARGAQLRYFSFLPRYISSDVPGWLLEFWFRLDYRLEMNDIRMRIEVDPTGKVPSGNALNMRRVRFRENINANSWVPSREWPAKGDIQRLDSLTTEQICLNTTMIVDVPNQRLLKPIFAPDNVHCAPPLAGSNQQQQYVVSGLPLDYFLYDPVEQIPSRQMRARIVLRRRLQSLALIRGLQEGWEPTSTAYLRLNKSDDPSWWHDKAKDNKNRADPDGRAVTELDGLTHREFMENTFGTGSFGGISNRNMVRGDRYK